MKELLKKQNIEVVEASKCVYTEEDAREISREFASKQTHVILALLTTFVPDYFIIHLLSECSQPVFLWAVEREMKCISLVGGVLITGALYNLKKKYTIAAGDIQDEKTLQKFLVFARASEMRDQIKRSRMGYTGGKNDIMLSMMPDEFELKRTFELSVYNIPIEEFYDISKMQTDKKIKNTWEEIKKTIGKVDVQEEDGLLSARYYLAVKELADKYRLDGISINCFPHLKSKICLAIALLNDELISAGCEGDLNSTIMMWILEKFSGEAAFNGDFLRMYNKDNSILFSHCGAGAFSLAESYREVALIRSIETCDGCAVCYPTSVSDDVTMLNLMAGKGGLRVSTLLGTGVTTDMEYEGTPLKVKFTKDIERILLDVCEKGAGHHWSGIRGNYMAELELLCKFCDVNYTDFSK